MADKPVTREEKYLAYLTGDYTGEIPKPITRKEKYLYELCLKGMGGEISPEEIKAAVNEYLEKNPVKPGATTEQAQQIEQNKTDVASLKEETGSLKEDLGNINKRVPYVYNRFEGDIYSGGYITNSGDLIKQSNWYYTDYISVNEKETLYHCMNQDLFACYDINKNVVTLITKINQNGFQVPKGVAYMRFSLSDEQYVSCNRRPYLTNNPEHKYDYTVKPINVYTEDEIDLLLNDKAQCVDTPSKSYNIIEGEYAIPINGKFQKAVNWGRTDFIKIASGEHLYHNFNKTIFAFYDSDKNFISQDITGITDIGTNFIVPESAAYIVLSNDVKTIYDNRYISTRDFFDGQQGRMLAKGYYVGEHSYLQKSIPLSALKEEIVEKIVEPDYIECWGDSLTMQGTWTKMLKEASGLPLYNFGVGGESSEAICSRQGALAMYVNNIVIPTEGGVIVANDFMKAHGLYNDEPVRTLLQGEGGGFTEKANSINPCYINGIEGVLSYESSTKNYIFTRTKSGEAVIIDRPTDIVTNAVKNYNKGIMIIFTGQNDTTVDLDKSVRLIKHMIEINQRTHKQYIVIIRHTGTAESMTTLEKRMVEEFGRNTLLLRPYLVEYGLKDNDLSPTTDDSAAIAVGSCPPSLLADSIHFNDKGKKAVGNAVIRKFRDLGYIN